MADTALSIMQDAFEQIKVYAPGVAINSADSSRALSCLNQMLDEWSNESLACFANVEQAIPLVPGKTQYTIGLTGTPDIVGPRPIRILTGMGAAYLVDSNKNRFPVNVVEQDVWNTIGLLTVTSQLPDTLFYDPQFPYGIFNIFATPLLGYTMYVDSRLQLADLPTLTTAFALPPGYMSAIKNGLALRLWPYYRNGTPDGWLIELASAALGKVKRSNIKISPSPYDSAVVSKAQSSYNIYNDSTNRGGTN